MLNLLFIFLGGGIASILRYLTNISLKKITILNSYNSIIPTLTVNIIGSFIIGLVYSLFMNKTNIPDYIKLAISVGFCGGLTTFSTFSLEGYQLIKEGEPFQALFYIILSVTTCFISVAIGIQLGNQLTKLI